jgi:hypothetical protein
MSFRLYFLLEIQQREQQILEYLTSDVREDFPWLSEVLTETYREIRDGDFKVTQRAIDRLRRLTRDLGRRDFIFELAPSKELHMMAMEMPRMLDHFLHRFEMRRSRPPDDAAGETAAAAESAKP